MVVWQSFCTMDVKKKKKTLITNQLIAFFWSLAIGNVRGGSVCKYDLSTTIKKKYIRSLFSHSYSAKPFHHSLIPPSLSRISPLTFPNRLHYSAPTNHSHSPTAQPALSTNRHSPFLSSPLSPVHLTFSSTDSPFPSPPYVIWSLYTCLPTLPNPFLCFNPSSGAFCT